MEKTIFAVITARGGSKRIPWKNIRPLAGKPLIAHTIHEALKSRYINRLVVSTDDDEIAEISRKSGADVPFARPANLATDRAGSTEVLIHAVEEMERIYSEEPCLVVLLEPTSPLRIVDDIDGAIAKHLETDADSVVGVMKGDNRHPLKAKRIEDGRLVDFTCGSNKVSDYNSEREIVRSQDLPPVYFRNGAFYSVKRDVLMNERTLYGKCTRPYVMPPERSIDINDELDFRLAGFLLEERNRPKAEKE